MVCVERITWLTKEGLQFVPAVCLVQASIGMKVKPKPCCPCLQNLEKQVEEKSSDSKKGQIPRTLVEYGGATTIHGIPYILEDGRQLFERVLWVVLVTVCAFGSLCFTIEIYQNWDEDPITTTIGTTEYDIGNLEYPSITICAQGSVKEIIGV